MIPFIPATLGSAVGAFIFWRGPASAFPRGLCALALVLVGFWSAPGGIETFKTRDPRPVVIDEVSAQYLGLLIQDPKTLIGLLAGFILFRILDAAKPFGLRRLENLPGAVGVMADDLASAVLGGALLRAATRGLGLPL